MKYFKRISDVHLKERLETLGAVLIEGPKWCGKTTTAEQQAKSIIRFQDPDERERNDGIAANRPSLFLKGETPRLIDEWQDYPVVWDAVRLEVDKRQTPGQFILTGSLATSSYAICDLCLNVEFDFGRPHLSLSE